MSSTARSVLLLALAVVVMVAGYVVLTSAARDREDPPPTPREDSAPETGRPPPPPSVRAETPRAAALPARPANEPKPAVEPAAPAPRPWERKPFLEDLAQFATVTGRVLDDRGKPVANAELDIHQRTPAFDDMIEEGPVVAAGRSRADGSFDLKEVPPGDHYHLEVKHPQFAPGALSGIAVKPAGRTDVGAVTLRVGASIRGCVRCRESGPVAGATVRVVDAAGPESPSARAAVVTRSAADGRYQLEHLAPGEVRVEVETADHAPAHAVRTLRSGERVANVDFRLVRGFSIRGEVVDDRGTPLGGARVAALGGAPTRYAESDETGRFVITGLPAGAYHLVASKRGHTLSSDAARAPIVARAGSSGARIRLDRCAVVLGRVLDARTKQPVTEFSVAWGEPGGRPESGRPFQSPDGRFEVDDLPCGRLRVEIRSLAHAPTTLAELRLAPGDRREVPTVYLTSGGVLTGRVLDGRSRRPIGGAQISARRPTPPHMLPADTRALSRMPPLNTTRTDADGRFEIRCVSGELVLVVGSPFHAMQRRRVAALPESGRRDLGDLILTRGGTIEGRVLDPGGRGCDGAEVWVQHEKAGYGRLVRTDAHGRFRLTHVPPGACLVHVTARGPRVSARELIDFVLAPPTTVVVVDGGVSRVGL